MTRFRTHILIALGVVFFVLLLLSNGLATFIVEWLWLSHLGFSGVLSRTIGARIGLGLAVWFAVAAFIYANAWWALRQTGGFSVVIPVDLGDGRANRTLNRTWIQRLTLALTILLSAVIGLAASSQWETVLLGLNASPFGYEDPIFGKDAAFYIFTLPMLHIPLGIAWTAGVLSMIFSVSIYALGGGIALGESAGRSSGGAGLFRLGSAVREHLSLLGGFFLVLTGVEFFLRRYSQLYDPGGLSAGPGYAVVHGTLPILLLQSLAALVAAGAVIYGVRRQQLRPLIIAAALVIATAILASFYPTAVQQFRVAPNEMTREEPYLKYHLDATRRAFGLDRVVERPLSGDAGLTRADIDANRTTLNSIRLWDAEPLLATLKQLQEIGQYYEFGSVDNDRYRLDGELRQLMLSPRELLVSQLQPQAATWVNETLTYTHGYGVAIAPVNEVTDNGLPELFVKNLPPESSYPELEIDRPELYYGEFMRQLVVVPSKNLEFDYPSGDQVQTARYEGTGGIAVGSIFRRMLLAMREGSLKPLLSTDFTADSRALLYRGIGDRVHRIAPFLTLDSDPYLVVHDGRLIWIMDAYTSADRFPFAQHVRGLGNYLRNSVKITIDAYNGTVEFFIADSDDPIIRAWDSAFPGLFQPLDAMEPGLRAHLRYPAELFALQARLFQTYHVTKPADFYKREGEWIVPSIEGTRMTPYTTVMKLPGESAEEFIVMLPFTPLNRPNLSAWMIARNDGEHYGELIVYQFPQGSFVKGPAQITGQINQDVKISEKLTLWNQRGSQATLGTLLVIPIEESLIYVQPLYLRAESGSIPELERVIVSYKDEIAMEPTLDAALARIFPPDGSTPSGGSLETADSDEATGETSPESGQGASPAGGGTPEATPQAEDGPPTPAGPRAPAGSDTSELIDSAEQHYEAAQQAARDGDWARYGKEIESLGDTLRRLREASQP